MKVAGSKAGVFYEVTVKPDSCSCPAFRFSPEKDCKHLRRVRGPIPQVCYSGGMDLTLPPVSTSRYQYGRHIGEAGGVIVRTTVGNPRFPLNCQSIQGREISPDPWMLKAPPSEGNFGDWYRAKLDAMGASAIQALFDKWIVQAASIGGPGTPIVLCCFEDVHAGKECHRRIFTQWWKEQSGEELPELPIGIPASKPEPLF